MPIYEYKCEQCGKTIEVFQDINDEAPTHCKCGAENSLKRIISPTSFRLTGTGWYETDFKKGPKSKAGTAQSNPKKESSDKPAKESAKTESKSDKPSKSKKNTSAAAS